MKKRILVLIPLVIALITVGAQLRPLPPRLDTAALMKSKLTASQKVLEGIAKEDFNAIARNANLLVGYSQAAGWMAQQSPDYTRFTADFRRQAQNLVSEARRKNVDGATVAYFQLTIRCENCHKIIRGDSVL